VNKGKKCEGGEGGRKRGGKVEGLQGEGRRESDYTGEKEEIMRYERGEKGRRLG